MIQQVFRKIYRCCVYQSGMTTSKLSDADMTRASCQKACLCNDIHFSGEVKQSKRHTHIHTHKHPRTRTQTGLLPQSLSLITITVKGRQSQVYDNLFIIILNRFSQALPPVCHQWMNEYQTVFVLGGQI